MPSPLSRCLSRALPLLALLLTVGPLTAQMTNDQAAALVLNSARKAYNEKNYPFAATRFREFLARYGDVDDSVHPAQTLQFAAALIRADKDFDLLILPGRNHEIQFDPYFVRRRWDYLVQHVMGETPPAGFVVRPPGD